MLSMVDANKKRMKLPLIDDPDNSRFSLFHGYKADISMDRAFGCLTYFALEHEFNDTSVSLAKPHDRSRRGLHVAYGGDGSLRDRRQPGYYNFTADYNQSRPVVTPRAAHGYLGYLGYLTPCDTSDTGYFGYTCITHTPVCVILALRLYPVYRACIRILRTQSPNM